MALALKVPDVLQKIDNKTMCLQAAADIQTYLNFERGKENTYSVDQIKQLTEVCSGLSTRDVQLDHVVEFSNGGSNSHENLRVYCAKHNRYRWRQDSCHVD